MLQVHPNTVRFHLDTLVSTGRVEQVAPDRKGPGRPALMFRAPRRMDRGGTTRTAGKEESIELLVDLLDDLGFAPERRGEEQVGLRHCPFPELVETRKAVICSIHQGIMQGALETWRAPVTVDRLDAFVEPDLCLAHLSRQGAST